MEKKSKPPRRDNREPHLLDSWILICWCMFVLGCCGPSRPTTIPVRGTITFGGQAPLSDGAIYFAPIRVAEGYDRRPGRARFDTSGSFEVSSFTDGDGLVPGTYRVTLECWKVPPTMDGHPGQSYIADDFTAPDVEVTAGGGRVIYDLDVPLNP